MTHSKTSNIQSIDRRNFNKSLLAVTAAGILPLSAFAQDKPKRGGVFRMALGHGSTTDTIDPAVHENGFQALLSNAIANTLTQVDPSGKVAPYLAETWEASTDAKTWHFKLRQGVTFHDGRTLTPNDVVASINYHRGEDSTSSVKPLADQIESIKVDGDMVVFTLVAGNADFPYTLDTSGFAIYPATDNGGIDWQSGIASGAYTLESFEPGVRATLKRNPNYWTDELGFFDEVEMLSIIDASARTNTLLTSEVDMIDKVDLKTVALMARRPGIKVDEIAGPLHYTFAMFTDQAPYNDNNVRLALKHSLDRDEMLATILQGHGTIGNDTPIGPSYRYFDKDLEPFPYDPDKAKFYLKEAGLTSVDIDLSAADSAYAGAVDAAILFKERAAKGGININVVREPNDGYWSDVWMKKPFTSVYWAGYATENTMLTTGYSEGAAWNDTHWKHDKFTALLNSAKAELNEELRRDMYYQIQKILRDEGGVVVPMFANSVFATSENVHYGELGNNGGIDGRRLIERWWRS